MTNLSHIRQLMEEHKTPFFKMLFYDNKFTNAAKNAGNNYTEESPTLDAAYAKIERIVDFITGSNKKSDIVFSVEFSRSKAANQGGQFGPYKFTYSGGDSPGGDSGQFPLSGMPNMGEFMQAQQAMISPQIQLAVGQANLDNERRVFEGEKNRWEEQKQRERQELDELRKVFESRSGAAKKALEDSFFTVLPKLAPGLAGMLAPGEAPLSGADQQEPPETPDEALIRSIADNIYKHYDAGHLVQQDIIRVGRQVEGVIRKIVEEKKTNPPLSDEHE